MPSFTDEQRRNAAVIISVGKEVGASTRDIQIALMTALQESGLRNLNYGDRDSQGLFQQRPSMGWGSIQQVTNPEYAAKAFFLGAGTNKGLLDYPNRNAWQLTQAAQAVQRSAYPSAYAKHEESAKGLLEALGDGQALPGTLGTVPGIEPDMPTIAEALQDTLGEHPAAPSGPPEADALGEPVNPALGEFTNPALGERENPVLGSDPGAAFAGATTPGNNPMLDLALPDVEQEFGVKVSEDAKGWRGEVVNLAKQFLGTPYVWGGADPSGFDCSGLLQYVFKQVGIDLPRVSYQQANFGKRVPLDQLKPGDLVAWDNSTRNPGADHIAVYIGDGKVIEAPRPGTSVQIGTIHGSGDAWGVSLGG